LILIYSPVIRTRSIVFYIFNPMLNYFGFPSKD
jgi:hypothetical protein